MNADILFSNLFKREISDIELKSSLKKLVEEGTLLEDIDKIRYASYTFLSLCAMMGYKESVHFLLEMGSNPDIKDPCGWTPLMNSVIYENLEIFKMLVNYSDLNITSLNGNSALMIAIELGLTECAKILIEKCTDTSIKNKYEETAYSIAYRKRNTTICDMLKGKKLILHN